MGRGGCLGGGGGGGAMDMSLFENVNLAIFAGNSH